MKMNIDQKAVFTDSLPHFIASVLPYFFFLFTFLIFQKKSVKNFLFLLSFAAILSSNAQTPIFQKLYGDIVIDDGQSIVCTSDSGYCIVGNSGPNAIDSSDISVYRLDRFGEILWTAKFGDPKDELGLDIIETADRGFVVIGNSYSSPMDTLYSDIYAAKLDEFGFISWAGNFGGGDYDEAQSVVPTSDGGFILFGSTMSYGSAFKSALAIKVDANGSQVWTKLFSMNYSNYFYRAHRTSDGNIIAVGGTFNVTGGTNFDHYVVKMNENGQLIWAKRYGTAGPDWLYDFTEVNNGYIFAGVSSNNTAGNADQNVFKTDLNGNLLWSYNYGTALYDRPSVIRTDASGNPVICGYSNTGSTAIPVNQMTLLKMDPSGMMVFSKVYGDPTSASEGIFMTTSKDGGFALVGLALNISDPAGDLYFVKTDENGVSGCLEAPVSFSRNNTTFTDSTGTNVSSVIMDEFPVNPVWNYYVNQYSRACFYNAIEQNNLSASVSIFPNPATDLITIELDHSNKTDIELCDLTGRVVKKAAASSDRIQLIVSDLASGIYNLNIRSTNLTASKRIIINR